jgi:1-pyrroline-4-hydroxy-2-carboxylate deaminase
MMKWQGVFPAATTQFAQDLSIDYTASQRVVDRLITDGVHGIVAMGTVGENNSILPDEKRKLLAAICEVAAGRVPVVAGVSELDTPRAAQYAKDAETIGADGLMLLPSMVYVPADDELEKHFPLCRGVNGLADNALQQPTRLPRQY